MSKYVKVKYKGNTVREMPGDGEFKLLTKETYMEDDLDIEVKRNADLDAKSITANGSYSASSDELDGYDEVTVNVPNTYTQSDEGKVVDDGALVAQGSQTITENGTYDTTLISELIADIEGGGGEFSVNDIVNILNKGPINSIVPFYTSATNPTGYTLSYSSQGGSSTPAWAIFNKTIDPVTSSGTSNVRWTTSQSAPQWVQIQLPEAKKINSFYISTYLQSGTNTCKTYKIQGSNDGATFTDIFSKTLEDEAIGKYVALPQETDAYLYYRIVVTESYHNTYIGLTSFFPMFIDAEIQTLIEKIITENGIYNPADDNADGYSKVTVNVPGGGGATVLGYSDFDFSNTSTAVTGDSTSGWVLSKLDSPTASSGDEQIICTKTAIDLTNVDYIEFLFAWLKTNHSTAGGTVFGVSASVPQDYSTAKNESVKITKGSGNNQGSEPKTIPAFIDVLDVSSLTGSYYIWCASKVTFSSSGYIDTKFKVELN